MVRTKATVLQSLRATLDERGYIEVETPILQLTNGGAAARPFRTHLNALDQDDAAAHRARARPQAGDDRRRRPGLRDRPHLPQRGPRLHPRGRVLDARGLRGLRRPVHDDGADQGARASTPRGPSAAPSSPAATAARSTSRASGARRRSSSWSPRRVGEQVDVDTDDGNAARATPTTHDVELQPEWGAGEIVVELYEQLVEDTLIQPDVRHGLPGSGQAAGQAAPQRARGSSRRGT